LQGTWDGLLHQTSEVGHRPRSAGVFISEKFPLLFQTSVLLWFNLRCVFGWSRVLQDVVLRDI